MAALNARVCSSYTGQSAARHVSQGITKQSDFKPVSDSVGHLSPPAAATYHTPALDSFSIPFQPVRLANQPLPGLLPSGAATAKEEASSRTQPVGITHPGSHRSVLVDDTATNVTNQHSVAPTPIALVSSDQAQSTAPSNQPSAESSSQPGEAPHIPSRAGDLQSDDATAQARPIDHPQMAVPAAMLPTTPAVILGQLASSDAASHIAATHSYAASGHRASPSSSVDTNASRSVPVPMGGQDLEEAVAAATAVAAASDSGKGAVIEGDASTDSEEEVTTGGATVEGRLRASVRLLKARVERANAENVQLEDLLKRADAGILGACNFPYVFVATDQWK